jgi:hypothetical protein
MSRHVLYGVMASLLLLLGQALYAQAPKYSNEFLSIGVGARGLAMSKAQVASVNDVTAAYWNPAGLVGIEQDLQVAAQHAEYFAGIAKYDYGAVAAKTDSNSALAFSAIRFGVDDIPNTTDLIDQNGRVNYDRITSFTAADYAFMVSYAKRLAVPGLSVGGNAKVIYRQIGDMAQAWGFGLDLGAQYHLKQWRFGATARDVTSTFNAWSFSLDDRTKEVFEATNNEIPQNGLELTLPKLSLGAARLFKVHEYVDVLAEFNMDITTDGRRNVLISGDPFSIDPNLGLEVDVMDIFYVRAGIGNMQQVKADVGNYTEYTFQPNIGVGVNIKNTVAIDYALTDIGDQSVALYSNVFSLRVAINKKAL